MTQLAIDPETHLLTGYERGRRWTVAQRDLVLRPECPVCRSLVDIQWLDVTANEADEREHGRTFVPGMWSCPHGCNPVTGERWHAGWQIVTNAEGWHYTCSCGVDEHGTGVLGLNKLHADHGGSA